MMSKGRKVMRLMNKETGEVRPAEAREDGIYLYDKLTEQWYKYGLDLLAEWWEYYEEPKKYWFIDAFGNIVQNEITKHFGDEYTDMTNEYKSQKQIGNRFETREEAKLAVEKLKALKRLKDKGFRFDGWSAGLGKNKIYTIFWSHNDGEFDLRKDLDLIFGGNE